MLESMEPTNKDASRDGSDLEMEQLFRSDDKALTEDRASVSACDPRLAPRRTASAQ